MSENIYIYINVAVFFIQLGIMGHAVYYLYKNIVDFGAIIEAIYVIWFMPVAYTYLGWIDGFAYTTEKIAAVYSAYFYYDIQTISYYNSISTAIMVAFIIGYDVYRTKRGPTFNFVILRKEIEDFSISRYYLLQTGLFLVWIILELRGFFYFDGSVVSFFSATNKDIYGSEYIKFLILKIPLLMYTNYVFKNSLQSKQGFGGLYFIVAIIAVLQTPQRRETISSILYLVLLLIIYRQSMHLKVKKHFYDSKKIRKMIISFFAFVILLVPLLWFLRVHDNRIYNYGASTVSYDRGFLEVMLGGSGSTGLPTMIVMDNFAKTNNHSFYLDQVSYFVESFIPRAIFPEKTVAINLYVRDANSVDMNMSLFYIVEMYSTFGIYSLLISVCIGAYISSVFSKHLCGDKFYNKIYLCLFVSNGLMFFKNGFASFMISIIFFAVLLWCNFSIMKCKIYVPRG